MGEYIDIGIEKSVLPLTIILSSLLLGIYALFGLKQKMMMMTQTQAVVA